MFLSKLCYSSLIVECSGAFEHNAFSRKFGLNLEYTSKFASRDLFVYINECEARDKADRRNKLNERDNLRRPERRLVKGLGAGRGPLDFVSVGDC